MNAWWDLFAVGPDAIGTWTANVARALAVVAAVALTLGFADRGAGWGRRVAS
jgi:hypothetical protein